MQTIKSFQKRFDSTLLKAAATRREAEIFIEESVACDFRAVVVPWYLMDKVVASVRGKDISAA
ncbi:deoxyribose-phosphate aldolase, partial [Mesotoga sp. SC_4PWA21]